MATKFGKGKKTKGSDEMETFSVSSEVFKEGKEAKSKTGGGGTPVPEGIYTVEVEECKREKSTWDDTKGAPEFNLTLKIIDGDPETKKQWAKRKLWMSRSITASNNAKAMPNYMRFLDALGVPEDAYSVDPDSGEVIMPLPSEAYVIGKQFKVQVTHKPGKEGRVFANPYFYFDKAGDAEEAPKKDKDKKKSKVAK
jgi:hypothetical protein